MKNCLDPVQAEIAGGGHEAQQADLNKAPTDIEKYGKGHTASCKINEF